MEKYEEQFVLTCKNSGYENISSEQLILFKKYYDFLSVWNEKINLTNITEINDVYLKHFADSVLGFNFFVNAKTIADIGTGAGFPGVVLAILLPNAKIYLVDALQKRVNFLNELVKDLNLKNCIVLHNRAEDIDFKEKYLNYFDCVTARAVSAMPTLTEYCLPFVKVGGNFIAYKSENVSRETLESEKAAKTMGGKKPEIITKKLCEDITRGFVVIKKQFATSKTYPRGQNKPKDSPIL